MMRHAGAGIHGDRMRGLVVVLWRAGLRMAEALDLAESDLDERRGALLVRHGKGGKRREVGIDDWVWEQLRPWTAQHASLPVGHLGGTHAGTAVGAGSRPHATATRRAGRRASPLRAASTSPCPRGRDGPRGRSAERDAAPARPHRPWRHVGLAARHRQRRNHRHDPCPQAADDARQRRSTPLTPNKDPVVIPGVSPRSGSVRVHGSLPAWPWEEVPPDRKTRYRRGNGPSRLLREEARS